MKVSLGSGCPGQPLITRRSPSFSARTRGDILDDVPDCDVGRNEAGGHAGSGRHESLPEIVQWPDGKDKAIEQQIHSLRTLQQRLRRFRRLCSTNDVETCAREKELCCLIADLPNSRLTKGECNEKTLLACASPAGRTRS